MSNQSLNTPCTGLCSTVYGDTVCRGCKRFDYEIIAWNGYNEQQKQVIWQRLEQLLARVMQPKIIIIDKQLLQKQLQHHQIRFQLSQSAYYWAYLLLQKGARHIKNIESYGIQLTQQSNGLSLLELREQIDQQFFELSQKILWQPHIN